MCTYVYTLKVAASLYMGRSTGEWCACANVCNVKYQKYLYVLVHGHMDQCLLSCVWVCNNVCIYLNIPAGMYCTFMSLCPNVCVHACMCASVGVCVYSWHQPLCWNLPKSIFPQVSQYHDKWAWHCWDNHNTPQQYISITPHCFGELYAIAW